MASAAAQNPNPLNLNIKLPPWLSGLRCPFTFLCPPPPPPPPPPPLPPPEPVVPRSRRLPSLRVTTEYDSEEGVFVNKVSCKLAGDLAKLRLSFQSDPQGQWQGGGEEGDPLQQLFTAPLVGLITKRFSVLYDVEARNALLRGDCSLPGGAIQLRASHDVKAQQGEVSVITSLGDPLYKLELSSLVPYSGLPRATFHFPIGQVSVEERRNEDDEKVLSVYGIGKSDFLDGVLTSQYNENDLNLRYCYKDKELTLVPSVSLPSNAVSIGFKRRFGPSDKLRITAWATYQVQTNQPVQTWKLPIRTTRC
ncbi:outer envelope pore protein 37, chloroplastic-like isoform X2 [Miscanthus floridulus]|uniref:outer envelope pore protein 37, chloroplastic-like isoform X2 n=1 Tax=Miscanthus floridulus TaxID=154761 RepID=UPI003458B655